MVNDPHKYNRDRQEAENQLQGLITEAGPATAVKPYEAMYGAVIRRLVEIADAGGTDAGRLADYDRVARAHERNGGAE